MENRDVGEALEDLRMRGDVREVQEGQQLVRVVAADARENDGDAVVGERVVQIGCAQLRSRRNPAVDARGIRHHAHVQPQ